MSASRRGAAEPAVPGTGRQLDLDAADVGSVRRCLPHAREVLAVCAHPDDESFGLGAIIAGFTAQGTLVRSLCFTHGEASTLGHDPRPLGEVRAEELSAAAEALGVREVELLNYPDGSLQQVPLDQLVRRVERALAEADLLLVFDEDGITGHPDHRRATQAALAAAAAVGVPVLAWALPQSVASQLNTEFGAGFAGHRLSDIDIIIDVDRKPQRVAIGHHASQSEDNPVLRRRLDLLGCREYLRWLDPQRASEPR
jgi:LmbE family N-acetylglucosaminyl deacetylase